jgi:hypothetical protein
MIAAKSFIILLAFKVVARLSSFPLWTRASARKRHSTKTIIFTGGSPNFKKSLVPKTSVDGGIEAQQSIVYN